MRLLLLAPPGAGKGTQGWVLSHRLDVAHLSSGDLLRERAEARDSCAQLIREHQMQGDLVPDALVLEVLAPKVLHAAAAGGFIVDGFPRNVQQAEVAADLAAKHGVTVDAVVYLHAAAEVLVQRLLARAEREGRSDDTPQVIRHRLDVFERETSPLVSYYRKRGVLLAVDADRPPEQVTADILDRLAELTPGHRAP